MRDLAQAIDQAAGFLRRQLAAGHYGMSCLGSDGTPRLEHDKGHLFAGFFIAEALDGLLTEIERTILLVRILSEENKGLWGYNPPAPYIGPEFEVFLVEADDSAFVIRTLRRLNINRSPSCLLAFHRPGANCFSTFNAPGDTRLVLEPSPANNLLAHPEVNANVFKALRGTNLENYINYDLVRMAQAEDGHWDSYFYPGPLYGTGMFLDLIQDQEWLADTRRKGIDFLLESQNADGSWGQPPDAYNTAVAAHALAICGEIGQPFARSIGYLLEHMGADGSWRTENVIWEFHATEVNVLRAYDTHGTFTTALCARALRRAAAASS